MSVSVSATVAVSADAGGPVVLIPDLTSAIQISRAYLVTVQQLSVTILASVQSAQAYAAEAQAAEDATRGLLTLAAGGIGLNVSTLTALLASLPTTLPPQSGVLWNNNGTVQFS